MTAQLAQAYFGSGCFWCAEAVFQRLKGVASVTSGYAGGKMANPSYEAVSSSTTGHAEVVKIEFNPAIISYEQLLSVFFSSHDPTSLNRQGNDFGEQYRSLILYVNQQQRQQAEDYIAKLTREKIYDKAIVTELQPLDHFYPAEDYHQDYYNQNKHQPYCQLVINPKLKKIKKEYRGLLKEE